MSQKQREIDLILLNGETRRAAATGNNAAWLCVCDRELPLLGRTGSLVGVSEGTRVDCPGCRRCFRVVPEDKNMGRARVVTEIL